MKDSNEKRNYLMPQITVIEILNERMICASGPAALARPGFLMNYVIVSDKDDVDVDDYDYESEPDYKNDGTDPFSGATDL